MNHVMQSQSVRFESKKDPSDVGMSGKLTGRGPVAGYDPPVQSYNGDYIPSLSSQSGSSIH